MAEPGSSQLIETLRTLLAAAQAGQIPSPITPAATPSAIPAPAPAPAAAPEPQAPAPRPSAPQQQQQQQPSSLLQQLRERATRELAAAPAQQEDPRTAFGRGVLSNRGSFLDNLSAGLQAQREAETAQQTALAAQREEMRRIAEAERQEQARRDLAEYQRRSLELRQQEAARNARPQFQVVGVDRATGYAVAVDPRDPTQTPRILQGVTPTQAARFSAQAENTLRTTASREARTLLDREIQDRTQRGERALSDADRRARLAELERERLAAFGLSPMPGATTAEPPAGQSGRPVVREGYVPPEQRR